MPNHKKIEFKRRLNKDARFEAKADDQVGEISGYACVYDVADLVGDIIRNGAFARAINNQIAAGSVPLMVKHFRDGGDAMESIGVITHAEETDIGLYFRAQLDGTPESQRMRQKILSNPAPFGSSIGWREHNYGWNELSTGGKEYSEIDLKEITITLMPTQEGTKGSLNGKDAREILEDLTKRLEALEKSTPKTGGKADDIAGEKQPKSSDALLEFARARREREIFLIRKGI